MDISLLLAAIADIVANAIRRTTLHEQTEQQLKRLKALRLIDQTITGSLDLHITFDVLLEHTMSQLHGDAADILTLNPYLHTLEYAAGQGFHSRAIAQSRIRSDEGIIRRTVFERKRQARRPIQVNDRVCPSCRD